MPDSGFARFHPYGCTSFYPPKTLQAPHAPLHWRIGLSSCCRQSSGFARPFWVRLGSLLIWLLGSSSFTHRICRKWPMSIFKPWNVTLRLTRPYSLLSLTCVWAWFAPLLIAWSPRAYCGKWLLSRAEFALFLRHKRQWNGINIPLHIYHDDLFLFLKISNMIAAKLEIYNIRIPMKFRAGLI